MDIVRVAYESTNGIFVQNRVLNRDYVVKATSHTKCELAYIVRGKIGLTINGDYVECIAGEVIMIEEKIYHSLRMFEGVETELHVVEFNPEIMPAFVKLNFLPMGDSPVWKYRMPAEEVKAANLLVGFKRINALAKKRMLPYKDALIFAEIIQLVSAINTQLDKTMQSGVKASDEAKQKKDLFEKCIHYINANLAKPISIDDIADAVHFSKSYLQHIFKQKMGMSISAYINTQKMSVARSMLAQGEQPSTVAQKLGYEYYTTFSVKFKRYYGISPKELRSIPFQENTDMEAMDFLKKNAKRDLVKEQLKYLKK